jgi:PAS domain S-box-containing protein
METDLIPVVDTLPGLVWTAKPDGYVDYLNRYWSEYTGLSVDDAYGAGWHCAIHPSDLPEMLESWQSILNSDKPSQMAARLRRFDDQYRWFTFRVRPLIDAAGHIVKWCGVSTDIEDLMRSEDADRADHYHSITDNVPAPIAFMTPGGELEDANRHVLEYFGASLKELKGWAVGDAIHPDDLAAVVSAWSQALDTGQYDIECRMRRADGIYRWFHVRGLPRRDARGHIARWHLLYTDVDDRRRAEARLEGEKQLLEMVAGGHPLPEILEGLCQLVETIAGECHCSVVLIDPIRKCLEQCTAPSLSPSFITSINGRPVNEDSCPCATAVCLNRQVIAADLASETRWTEYAWCPMAMAHGLQACWSTPISSTAENVLGAFAIYYCKPRTPTTEQQSLISQFTHIASIAIERAQSDAALRRSEARKAAILDSALDCIVTIDHEGYVTEFNPAAERTFGYFRHEVVGKQLAEVIVPPALRDKHRTGLGRYLATGDGQLMGKRAEMTAVRADGTEFPVELAISRIAIDGPPSFTGYLRDITERKRSEERLRRNSAHLTEAQELSMTGSFSWKVFESERYWSRQTFRIFEYDPSTRATLELMLDRIHPLDVPHVRRMLDLAADGRDLDYECRLLMPNGAVKHLHIVAHGTRDRDGNLEYTGAVQDVTKRKLSEEALGEVRSELAHVARVASLGALTASIAHEVNQPLAGIVTNASTCLRMLAADPPNVEGARETARRTIRDGNRASDVIVRLRALFGKTRTTTEPVDLNEATQEVLALLSSDIEKHRVELRQELDAGLPLVTGDRVQLQQVILNLLRNAVDAMKAIDDRTRRLVIRTGSEGSDLVRMTVQDVGIGFQSKDANRLFDSFYTTKGDGMGIGLSVSRSIIESHRGRLWAAANDGPGATFSFAIPANPSVTETSIGTAPLSPLL